MPTPAGPGTNEYKCESCGRFFTREGEYIEHQKQCEAAELKHHEAGRDYEDRDWVSTP